MNGFPKEITTDCDEDFSLIPNFVTEEIFLPNTPVSADTAAFRRLRSLKKKLKETYDQNIQVQILISACIAEEFDTGPRIIAVLDCLGYNRRHVGIILSKGTGGNRNIHHWFRSADGLYRDHEPASITAN